MLALPEVIVFGLAGAAVIAAFALLLSVVGDWSWAHPSHRAWTMIVTGSVEVVVGALLAVGGVRFWLAMVIMALGGVVLVVSGARHLRRARSSTSSESR